MNYGWQGTKQMFFGSHIHTYRRNQMLNPACCAYVHRVKKWQQTLYKLYIWLRLNITSQSDQCPANFKTTTANGTSFCIRNTTEGGCGPMLFESHGHTYSSVCGHIQGYSYNTASAFNTEPDTPLNGHYVDGVSITYGTPPTHIWTYAAGNVVSENSVHGCPCNVNRSNSTIHVP